VGAHSTASVRDTAICPAREAMVCGIPTPGPRCTGMTMLTIQPCSARAIQRRPASCIMYQVP
jgi:hypothetical protein